MSAAVVLIASLDTKPDEALFLRRLLEADGIAVRLLDFGVRDDPAIVPDVSAAETAQLGGGDLAQLRQAGNRASAIGVMAKGAASALRDISERGELLGVLAIGGSGGTTVGTAAMRGLPLGMPKVMVSTIASGDTRPFVDISDIVMLNSVADFSGLNPISETILTNAAGALAGMIRLRATCETAPQRGNLVAATMFGVTTPAVEKCRSMLAQFGYKLVPFHATGVGGRTMESLIEQGYFVGVLDLTTTEWADEIVGGNLSAGPRRLEAAGKMGLPQVVAPGALDMVNFFGSDGVPAGFGGRLIHRHSEHSYLMRTTPEENAEVGRRIAEKLNFARGPVTILFPVQGISALDRAGALFHSPDADKALLDALTTHCSRAITIRTMDCHINDDAFARAAVETLLASLNDKEVEHAHA
jgi:uncharacterized protein (UPF0261 family)